MTTAEKVIQNSMDPIKLAEQLVNISQACKIIGYSQVESPMADAVHFWRTGRMAARVDPCNASTHLPSIRPKLPHN